MFTQVKDRHEKKAQGECRCPDKEQWNHARPDWLYVQLK